MATEVNSKDSEGGEGVPLILDLHVGSTDTRGPVHPCDCSLLVIGGAQNLFCMPCICHMPVAMPCHMAMQCTNMHWQPVLVHIVQTCDLNTIGNTSCSP